LWYNIREVGKGQLDKRYFVSFSKFMLMAKKNSKYKFRYSLDSLNRLVISHAFAPESALHKKIVVNGSFTVDKNNALEYHVKAPTSEFKQLLACTGNSNQLHTIKFKGKWSLTPDHNLKFSLLESRTQMLGNNLVLTGNIISVKSSELLFSVIARGKDSSYRMRILKLSGHWQAARGNRLKFLIQRYRQPNDALLFQGAWDIGQNYEIIYKYKKTELKTKIRTDNEFTLAGIWDIFAKKQLKFLVNGDTESTLNFKAELQTPIIYAKKGEIRYSVGIGVNTQNRIVKKITYSGKWRINRDLSLDFKMKYKSGRVRWNHFKADYSIDSKNKISVVLKNNDDKNIGIEVIFTKKFFEDAETFVRWRDSVDERAIEAGVRIPF